jgi:glycolate oxidase FAD binding subunit
MTLDSPLQEIQQRVLAAAASRSPLRIRGAGSKDFLGYSGPGEVLDMRVLAGVVDYEPSELVITARAGTRLADIERTLSAEGQYLAFEPPDFGAEATIGGVVAAALAGPRRVTAGAVRDFVLGAELMSSSGELLQFGGRVMKNVAGFDVSRLLCGSLGILGPITAVSLKVLPRPRYEATVAFELGQQEAIDLFNRALRRPVPVSATSWCSGVARIRLSGSQPAVDVAVRDLGGTRIDAAEADHWWQCLRHHALEFFDQRRALWRVSVPAASRELPLDGAPLIEWGGALRWYREALDAATVRQAARAVGGTAACWYGDDGVPVFDELSPAVLEIHRRLKQHFDPAGIFNRGRLVPGL